jgi:hypothetical protein
MLEVLVSIAIFSISSVLIFSSLLQYSRLSSRIEDVSLQTLHQQVGPGTFEYLVTGIVPGWPDTQADAFIGSSQGFSAASTHGLFADGRGLRQIRLELSEDRMTLFAADQNARAVLHQFASPAGFSYLGNAGVWAEEWPPAQRQDFGAYDDTALYESTPLPRAVRIQVADRSELDWIARLGWQAPRLIRAQDAEID